MNRADSRAGQHGDGRFRDGGQINDDAIAFANAVSEEDVGETAYLTVQLLIGERAPSLPVRLPR